MVCHSIECACVFHGQMCNCREGEGEKEGGREEESEMGIEAGAETDRRPGAI